jgi:hypothetical protein
MEPDLCTNNAEVQLNPLDRRESKIVKVWEFVGQCLGHLPIITSHGVTACFLTNASLKQCDAPQFFPEFSSPFHKRVIRRVKPQLPQGNPKGHGKKMGEIFCTLRYNAHDTCAILSHPGVFSLNDPGRPIA